MNEATLSYTIKAICPDGYDEMFTIRSDDSADYFSKITALKKWLVANGYTPTGRRSPNAANAAPAGTVPICKFHGPMKPSTKHAGFYCPAKLHDGSYCKEKADPAAPMPQAAAVLHAVNGRTRPMFNDDPPPPETYYSSE